MKFYIATKLENHAQHNVIRDRLHLMGHEITYDWTVHGSVHSRGLDVIRDVAVKEANGVREADIVIVLWPGGRGTHVEMGIAIGAYKPIFMLSEVPGHHISSPETSAFYHHPCVLLCKTLDDLFITLHTRRPQCLGR